LIVFIFFSTMWANGHGIHLSSNGIKNNMERTGLPARQSLVFQITDFYDEDLGHYLWFIGAIGCSILLLRIQDWHAFLPSNSGGGKRKTGSRPAPRASSSPSRKKGRTTGPENNQGESSRLLPEFLAGLIHGFVHFCMFVEAGLVPAGFLFVSLGLVTLYQRMVLRNAGWESVPVHFLFVVTYATALALLLVWGYLNDWTFPEFSDVLDVFKHKVEAAGPAH
jgi:hypothetical protein